MECLSSEAKAYLRVLEQTCFRHGLLLNGGGRHYVLRSYATPYWEKRSRYFLTMPLGDQRDQDEILAVVKEDLRNHLLRAVLGWESTYELREDCTVVYAADLQFLTSEAILRLCKEVVVVSKNRVVVKLTQRTWDTDLTRE